MLTLKSAAFGYGRKSVVEGIDLSLQGGEIITILGANGAGKSTVVKTLLGLQSLLAGTLDWHGTRPSPIAYLSQLTDFDRHFPMNVRTLVASGTWGQPRARKNALTTPQRVAKALAQVEMAEYAHVPVHELSGGQLQRARFARALVQDAELMILDEPFAAVDQRRESKLLDLIQSWAHGRRAVILVLHDLSAALKMCSKALLLGEGGGDFGPTAEVLTADRLIARGYITQAQADLMHGAMHA